MTNKLIVFTKMFAIIIFVCVVFSHYFLFLETYLDIIFRYFYEVKNIVKSNMLTSTFFTFPKISSQTSWDHWSTFIILFLGELSNSKVKLDLIHLFICGYEVRTPFLSINMIQKLFRKKFETKRSLLKITFVSKLNDNTAYHFSLHFAQSLCNKWLC